MGALANWSDRFWGAHASRVLAKAFRLRELSWSFAIYTYYEPKEKFVSAERRNQHSARVRSPEDFAMAAYRPTGDATAA